MEFKYNRVPGYDWCFPDVVIKPLPLGEYVFISSKGIFPGRALFRYSIGMPIPKKPEVSMELRCTNEQKIEVAINPVTEAGTPVTLDGPVTVDVIGGDGTVERINDNSFFVVSGSFPGDTQFLVRGDADLGAGVVEISDVIILHVEGALAKSLGLQAKAPVLK